MKQSGLAGTVLFLATVVMVPISYGQAEAPALARFPFEQSVPLKIVREAIPMRPFTVAGPRGAILGQQDGSFEAWIFPWKVVSNFRITAEMEN
jgi:hypothetical protein